MFTEIYDGREQGSVGAKQNMKTLDYGMLYNGDIVLMECQIRRYKQDRTQTSWAKFRTNFRLSKVTLLWNATRDVPQIVESPADDEREEPTDDEDVVAF